MRAMPTPAAPPCIRCGQTVTADNLDEILARRVQPYIDAGHHVATMVPVLWCEECAPVRDDWIAALRSAVDVGITPDMLHRMNPDAWDDGGDVVRADGSVMSPRAYLALLRQAADELPRVRERTDAALAAARPRRDSEMELLAGRTRDLFDAWARFLGQNAQRTYKQLRSFVPPVWLNGVKHTDPMPRWAGTHSLAYVDAACEQAARVEQLREGVSPAWPVYVCARGALRLAHPVVMAPEQLAALPRLGGDTLVEFARSYRLPFNPLYLDFTNGDGLMPALDDTMVLAGALVWRTAGTEERPLSVHDQDGALTIVPFLHVPREDGRADWRDPACYETPGTATFAERGPAGDTAVIMSQHAAATPLRSMSIMSDSVTDGYVTAAVPGVEVASVVARHGLHNWMDHIDDHTATVIGALMASALQLGEAVMRALWFMDAANVHVQHEAAPMDRREVKRAAKRGWARASAVVVVRHSRGRPNADHRVGVARDYTHQWEVAGHFRHVTRGSHVACESCLGRGRHDVWTLPGDVRVPGPGPYLIDGNPHPVEARESSVPCEACDATGLDVAKVKPCARRDDAGNLTCPNGCRREYVPAHVAGPDDKPLMLKTRRVA